MVASHKWIHGDAAVTRYGDMICKTCHKPILYGEYRYRLNGTVQHVVCVKGRHTPEEDYLHRWNFQVARRLAVEAFVQQWNGNMQLCDEIDEIIKRGVR